MSPYRTGSNNTSASTNTSAVTIQVQSHVFFTLQETVIQLQSHDFLPYMKEQYKCRAIRKQHYKCESMPPFSKGSNNTRAKPCPLTLQKATIQVGSHQEATIQVLSHQEATLQVRINVPLFYRKQQYKGEAMSPYPTGSNNTSGEASGSNSTCSQKTTGENRIDLSQLGGHKASQNE